MRKHKPQTDRNNMVNSQNDFTFHVFDFKFMRYYIVFN